MNGGREKAEVVEEVHSFIFQQARGRMWSSRLRPRALPQLKADSLFSGQIFTCIYIQHLVLWIEAQKQAPVGCECVGELRRTPCSYEITDSVRTTERGSTFQL